MPAIEIASNIDAISAIDIDVRSVRSFKHFELQLLNIPPIKTAKADGTPVFTPVDLLIKNIKFTKDLYVIRGKSPSYHLFLTLFNTAPSLNGKTMNQIFFDELAKNHNYVTAANLRLFDKRGEVMDSLAMQLQLTSASDQTNVMFDWEASVHDEYHDRPSESFWVMKVLDDLDYIEKFLEKISTIPFK